MLRVCDAADRAIDDQVSRSSGGAPPKHVQFARLCVIPPNSPSTSQLDDLAASGACALGVGRKRPII